MRTIRTSVLGADGRMGSTFIRHAPCDFVFVGGVVRDGNPLVGKSFEEAGLAPSRARIETMGSLEAMLEQSDLLVSFSSPLAEVQALPLAARRGVSIISGTTGHSAEERVSLEREVGSRTRAVVSSNFSLGMALIEKALKSFGALRQHFTAGIVEIHHSGKKDAPSGTAISLMNALRDRTGDAVPVVSLRLGAIPGRHDIVLSGKDETVEIRHEAIGRRPFAEGAYLASRWVVAPRPNGIYTFSDVLEGHDGL